MKRVIITNGRIVNEGKIFSSDILIENGRIEKIADSISHSNAEVIDAGNNFVIPGLIDDQVHFREPGLTHKGEIYTEARAGVAGGTTSYMEMPNTVPNALTQELLQDKYEIAQRKSLANYSFYMGVSNDNYEEVMRTNSENVCGIKIFMGSSTGNMLVDKLPVLEKVFGNSPMLIATHCEDETTIRRNMDEAKARYGENVPIEMHPEIRSAEACYLSSSFAVGLAKKFGTRLHVLHISTEKELSLFDAKTPLEQKRITAEVCTHHLFFNSDDYTRLGTKIKWNPAVKSKNDQQALLKGLLDNHLDVLATDHAPHTLEEKAQTYFKAPSGGPLIQHALQAIMEFYHAGKISMETIVQKSSHNVATCFNIKDRGFIREGYFADLVIVNPNKEMTVIPENILAKCKWSPFENYTFRSSVEKTFVNGNLIYDNGQIFEEHKGERLTFKAR
ncbi:MAG: dihydroorotase [Bacteroidetes bacterium]|nr:dihydroorotase [Bacteroidota bacterium]